jgi:diacylglycerol kinase family enzyme
MLPIALIVNPNCKSNRKDPGRVERLRRQLGDDGLFFETKDGEAVVDAAKACLRAGAEVVGINGGDGSLHLTLTKIIEVYGDTPLPRIVFLRGGTQNTVANSCDVRGGPEQVLDYLLTARDRGAHFVEIERDILRVGDEYGFIFGNGFVHQFLAEYYARGEPSQWNAFMTLFVGCCSVAVRGQIARRMFRRFRGRVTVDRVEWPAPDYTGIVGSTIEQVGLGFRPFVRCEERPGSFHLLGITAGAMGFAVELPRIRLGLPLNEGKILNAVCQNVLFESDEPLLYIVDGDTHAAGNRLELGVGPRLRLIVPQPIPAEIGVTRRAPVESPSMPLTRVVAG